MTNEHKFTKQNKDYFLDKLKFINRSMAVHIGDANRRLASEAQNISLIDEHLIPVNHREDFLKIQKVVRNALKNHNSDYYELYKIDGIRNSTAVKYIEKLWYLEDVIVGR
jgi:hypothetical protein